MLRTGSPSLLSLFFLGLLSSSVAQHRPGETSQSSTVLRTTTRLVLLNVVAVDERGAPVLDLKEEDFTFWKTASRKRFPASGCCSL